MPTPRPTRQRLCFDDRAALQRAAGRVLDDPGVESCTIDLPNLVLEVGLANHVVQKQQALADWRRRMERSRR